MRSLSFFSFSDLDSASFSAGVLGAYLELFILCLNTCVCVEIVLVRSGDGCDSGGCVPGWSCIYSAAVLRIGLYLFKFILSVAVNPWRNVHVSNRALCVVNV